MWCHCQVKIFLGLRIWAADKPNAVSSIDSIQNTEGWWKWKLWFSFKPFVHQSHDILRRCRRPLVISNALAWLCILCIPKIGLYAVKVAVKLQSRWKGRFWALVFTGWDTPDCGHHGTCIFKSHSLPSVWPVLVAFRSASSEGNWRKEKDR